MRSIIFDYRGVWYSGSLLVTNSPISEYVWCFSGHHELVRALGTCITFRLRYGKLFPTHPADAVYGELVETLKLAILPLIQVEDALMEP